MSTQPTPCPFCRSIVLVNLKWAEVNGRVFCNCCCKSFDIYVGEEVNEPDTKVEQAVQEISAPLEIEETEDELTTLDLVDHDGFWY